MRAGGAAVEIATDGTVVPDEAALAKQNEASMRELANMMGGLRT